MIVLGIDPGIETTGFAVLRVVGAERELVEYGVIRTSSTLAVPERLAIIHTDIQGILDRYADIEIAGVEELFFAKNVTSAFKVGQARGVILFTLHAAGVTIEEVKPVEVKAEVTGNGGADKQAVQRMIQFEFGLDSPPTPDDAADAIAIALCTALRQRQNQ